MNSGADAAAKNFRDVVQGFIALASLQGSSKPEVKAVVQSLALSGTGKTVALSFSIPGRIVDALERFLSGTPPSKRRAGRRA